MMEQTIDYKGYEICIYQDEDYHNPDSWGNDECFLVYDHRDFYVQRDGFDPTEIFHESWDKNKSTYRGYWTFGVDAYIHSGVVLAIRGSAKAARFPDRRWDVSFKGFALIKRQKGTYTYKQAIEAARSLVDEWNICLSGEVYGYSIKELDESCWGYYGNPEESNCIDDAKSHIDWHVREEAKKKAKKVKQWIQNKVPFEYRKELV